MLYQSLIQTPLGSMIAVATDQALSLLAFEDAAQESTINALAQRLGMPMAQRSNPVLGTLQQELNAYFRGDLHSFSVPVMHVGTPFQKIVWAALQTIPFGQTVSYKHVAAAIGRPTAYRAVASANRANPIAIVVPCHRVIKYDGQLCGYNGGLVRKQELLAYEGRSF